MHSLGDERRLAIDEPKHVVMRGLRQAVMQLPHPRHLLSSMSGCNEAGSIMPAATESCIARK